MPLATEFNYCRVCGGANIIKAGTVEYYSGFAWPVYDCRECRCRFTMHDESIYEAMHSEQGSVYNVYRSLLSNCVQSFNEKDLTTLRRELCQTPKYRFVIEQIESGPKNARVLEIGCSRGYLTSFFILAGYDVTGVDVSESAVRSAKEAFGDHFLLEGDPRIAGNGPYDVIYHVGTIGCVADPIALTRRLLGMLRPGGRMIFNAPNLNSCWLDGQLWIDAAPPPDLVSIFPPGFWRNWFSQEADVEEVIETCEPNKAFTVGLRRFFRRSWQPPVPSPIDRSSDRYISGERKRNGARAPIGEMLWRNFEASITRVSQMTGVTRLAPAQPAEFGIYVKMVRKGLPAPIAS